MRTECASTNGRRSLAAVLAALALLAAAAPAAGAVQDEPRERLTIDVEADGDATVTTTLTYDLGDEAERQAFDDLASGGASEAADRYAGRLRGIADRVAAETGREMTVSGASAETERVGDVGVVRLSARWTNLAAVDGERVVLSAPLDGGFETDRPVVVRAPDGYEVAEASVQPSERSGGAATWSGETDLSGFSATMAPSDSLPLSPAIPLAALALAALGLRCRRDAG